MRRISRKQYKNARFQVNNDRLRLANMLKKLYKVPCTDNQVEACMYLLLYNFQKQEESLVVGQSRDPLIFSSSPKHWDKTPFSALAKSVEILVNNRLAASDVIFKSGHLCLVVLPAFSADQIRGFFKGIKPDGYE